MTDIRTAEDLIAAATATEIVRHNGSRSPREPYMTRADAERLAAKVGRPGYYRWSSEPQSADRVWDFALTHSLLMHDLFGWIDRDGTFYGCGHAAHEMLLWVLDTPITEAEDGGWVRVSMGYLQSRFAPSDAQLRRLDQMGRLQDAKKLMDKPALGRRRRPLYARNPEDAA